MRYASGDRRKALLDAYQHNLSVLGEVLKRNGIESIEIDFAAPGVDDEAESVEVGFGTVKGPSASLSPALLAETVDGLQDVEWSGSRIERQAMQPVSFQEALKDACLEAAGLRDGEWKRHGGRGTVTMYGDGVADLTMRVFRPEELGEEYYPRPAPLEGETGLPEPRPDGQ